MQNQNEHKIFTRTYHNYSNINFNQTQPISHQPAPNFRSMSQVGRMMTDVVQQPNQSRSIYHYNNKIAQVQKDYPFTFANDPCFEKNNVKYEQFYVQAKKFIKPYTQCTKFSDSLMKNRQLLRRGQFDLPVEPITPVGVSLKNTGAFSQSSAKTHSTDFQKTKNLLRKNSQTMQNIRKRKPSSDQKNGFDKTLKQHTFTYATLLKQQRKNQKDQIKLQNSMNRILAAEMISYRLLSANNYMKPSSVRTQARRQ